MQLKNPGRKQVQLAAESLEGKMNESQRSSHGIGLDPDPTIDEWSNELWIWTQWLQVQDQLFNETLPWKKNMSGIELKLTIRLFIPSLMLGFIVERTISQTLFLSYS